MVSIYHAKDTENIKLHLVRLLKYLENLTWSKKSLLHPAMKYGAFEPNIAPRNIRSKLCSHWKISSGKWTITEKKRKKKREKIGQTTEKWVWDLYNRKCHHNVTFWRSKRIIYSIFSAGFFYPYVKAFSPHPNRWHPNPRQFSVQYTARCDICPLNTPKNSGLHWFICFNINHIFFGILCQILNFLSFFTLNYECFRLLTFFPLCFYRCLQTFCQILF